MQGLGCRLYWNLEPWKVWGGCSGANPILCSIAAIVLSASLLYLRRRRTGRGGVMDKRFVELVDGSIMDVVAVESHQTIEDMVRVAEELDEERLLLEARVQELEAERDHNRWVAWEDERPPEGEVVSMVKLSREGGVLNWCEGSLEHYDEGWLVGVSYRTTYDPVNQVWDTDESEEGDFEPTHWCRLPLLPPLPKGGE